MDPSATSPLLPTQRRLWELQRSPEVGPYTSTCTLSLSGDLDLERLDQAVGMMAARHGALRLAFPTAGLSSEGYPQLMIGEVPRVWFGRHDLTTRRGHDRCAALARCASEVEHLASLSLGAELRVSAVRLAEDRHAITFALPAMCADAATVLRIARDVVAELSGPSPVAPKELAYDSVAAWWNEMANSPQGAGVREFWRSRCTGWDQPVTLPGQRLGRPVRCRPAVLTRVLPDITGTALRRLCPTPHEMRGWLLACWQLLVRRVARVDNLIMGVGTDLRRHDDLRTCAGPLTISLPLRTDSGLHTPIAEVAAAVAEQIADGAGRAEWFSWERCVPPGGIGQLAWFPVAFEFDEVAADWAVGGLRASLTEVRSHYDRFVARLSCWDTGHAVRLELGYEAGVLPGWAAQALMESFLALVGDSVAHPQAPGRDLDLVGTRQRRLLLQWAGGQETSSPDTCLGELVGAQAARRPAATAVTCGTQSLTYRELDRWANQLAHHLRTCGVGPEVRVGVCLDRSVELVVALLAVTRAGGAYVPVDPEHPRARIADTFTDAGVRAVVTTGRVAERIPADLAAPTVRLDEQAATIGGYPAEAPEPGTVPDNLLYVIYTSGSTGRPKGVMVTHANAARLLTVTRRWFSFGPQDTWTLFHTTAFDFAVWELWGALIHGGRLVVVPSQTARSPEDFRALLIREKVTVLNQTPGAFRGLLAAEQTAGLDCGMPSLRVVVFGGEALTPGMLAGWFARYGDRGPALANMYGTTETTVHATYHALSAGDADVADEGVLDASVSRTPQSSPIGVPLADLSAYVVDAELSPVPAGVVGELYVGGSGLARGYWGRAGLTAERFVPDLFGDGGRLYRTGDRVRWLPGGGLDFVGRMDGQVKVRGFRVELGEVEAVLADHHGVRDVVVTTTADEDGSGSRRLVAYVVAQSRGAVSVAGLREFVAARLPEYLVPAAFVQLEALPLTRNGKVDRAALPAPDRVRPELEQRYVAPRDEAERVLAGIWAEVLGVDRVGVHDNFFTLGGDSILSITVMSRAARRGLRITAREFFENQTVGDLARAATPIVVSGRDLPSPTTGRTPLTPVQCWFFEQRLACPGHHNQAWLFRVSPSVQADRLAAALKAVFTRHDAFRMRFRRDPQAPAEWRAQCDAPDPHLASAAFWTVDLSGARHWEVALARTLAQAQEFDLERGPLMRAVLIDGPRQDQRRLLLVAHHLVIDAVSWRIVLDDLRTAYRYCDGTAGPLDRTTSFAAWAEALGGLAGGLATDLEFWRSQRSPDHIALPRDYAADGAGSYADANQIHRFLDAERTGALRRDLTRVRRSRVDEVLLTAVAQAVAAWTGRRYLFVDVEGHGREQHLLDGVDLSRTVGWFTTIAPLLIQLPDGENCVGELAAVTEQLRAVPWHGLSYGALRHLDPVHSRELAAAPTPQISFNYLGQFDLRSRATGTPAGTGLDFELAPEPLPRLQHPDNHRPHLLDVTAVVDGGCLRLSIGYSNAHHSRVTIGRLADEVQSRLGVLIDHCMREDARLRPDDFPLLPGDQQHLDKVLAKALAAAPSPAADPTRDAPG